jgi:hypothetical protein
MHAIGLPKRLQPLPPTAHSLEVLDPVEPIDPKVLPFDVYDQFVDRADLPPCLEKYQGAFLASQELVRHADRNTSPTRYRRWGKQLYADPSRYPETHGIWAGPKWHLTVEERHGLWFITRQHASVRNWYVQGLSFVLGPSLFCARSSEAAKRLAVFFHFAPVEAAGGVLWMKQTDE